MDKFNMFVAGVCVVALVIETHEYKRTFWIVSLTVVSIINLIAGLI